MIDKKCLICDFYDEYFKCFCPPDERPYDCILADECTSDECILEDFITIEEMKKREKHKR